MTLKKIKNASVAGIEPATFGLEVQRAIRCAKRTGTLMFGICSI